MCVRCGTWGWWCNRKRLRGVKCSGSPRNEEYAKRKHQAVAAAAIPAAPPTGEHDVHKVDDRAACAACGRSCPWGQQTKRFRKHTCTGTPKVDRIGQPWVLKKGDVLGKPGRAAKTPEEVSRSLWARKTRKAKEAARKAGPPPPSSKR